MLDKMKLVLEDPREAQNKAKIEASFGRHAFDAENLKKIRDTVEMLESTNLRILLSENTKASHITPAEGAGGKPYGEAKKTSKSKVVDSVKISGGYFDDVSQPSSMTLDEAAAELIYQASIFSSHTNGYVSGSESNNDSWSVVPLGTWTSPPGAQIHKAQCVCEGLGPSGDRTYPQTPQEANSDTNWANIKGRVRNMDKCAESYKVFAYLCDPTPYTYRPIDRRDVAPWERTVLDDEIENGLSYIPGYWF